MPSVLHLTPQDLDTTEKRSKYTVAVVGCEREGILYAKAFAEAGFKVICADAAPNIVRRLGRGKTDFASQEVEAKLKKLLSTEQLSVCGEIKKAVASSEIVVVSVPVRIDDNKKTDSSEAQNACKQVGTALKQGALVFYSEVAGLGFIEGNVREILENTSGLKAGAGFGLAYCPLLLGDLSGEALDVKFAAVDTISLQAAANILNTITDNAKSVCDLKTAETAVLFSIAKMDADKALANEFAVLCEKIGIDYYEVIKSLELNSAVFAPSLIEENKAKAYLLLESADNFNAKLRLSTAARQINEDMVKHAVNLVQDALHGCGRTLRRAKVAVVGTVDPASTSHFVKLLEQKGGKVNLYDALQKKEGLEARLVKSSLSEAVEGAECLVLLSRNERPSLSLKKLKALMKSPAVIVDLTGSFDSSVVRTEGFIYFGLGRGSG